MIDDYDKRQLQQMQKKLKSFCEGELSLSCLVNDLSGLLNVLQTIDEDWRTDFRTHWFNLEIAYAVALDEEKDCLNKESKVIIMDSISELKKLISIFLRPLSSS